MEMKKVRTAVRGGGCILQVSLDQAQLYIPASLTSSNKGWKNRWFYLHNNDGRLPSYTKRVVTAAKENWRWALLKGNVPLGHFLICFGG
jgi:hypothetical protein